MRITLGSHAHMQVVCHHAVHERSKAFVCFEVCNLPGASRLVTPQRLTRMVAESRKRRWTKPDAAMQGLPTCIALGSHAHMQVV